MERIALLLSGTITLGIVALLGLGLGTAAIDDITAAHAKPVASPVAQVSGSGGLQASDSLAVTVSGSGGLQAASPLTLTVNGEGGLQAD